MPRSPRRRRHPARWATALSCSPKNTLSLGNKFFDITPAFAAGLGLIYQGSSYPNADNLVTPPSFTLVHFVLYYSFAGRQDPGWR